MKHAFGCYLGHAFASNGRRMQDRLLVGRGSYAGGQGQGAAFPVELAVHGLSTCQTSKSRSTPDDAAAVSALLKASYRRLLPGHYPDQALAAALPLMTQARPELLISGTYFVCIDGVCGSIVGCGGWTMAAPDGANAPGLAHVRHFATSPTHLRSGVGKAILQRCLQEMRSGGARDADCLSTLMAEPFYASQGFRRVGIETVRLGGEVDFPAVRMRRAL